MYVHVYTCSCEVEASGMNQTRYHTVNEHVKLGKILAN